MLCWSAIWRSRAYISERLRSSCSTGRYGTAWKSPFFSSSSLKYPRVTVSCCMARSWSENDMEPMNWLRLIDESFHTEMDRRSCDRSVVL
jgi:hypothetical protein